jgi:hypothetical protein
MKSLSAITLLLFFSGYLAAQCPSAPALGNLQSMAKSSSESRLNKIRKQGFAPAGEKPTEDGKGVVTTFQKCSNIDANGKAIFHQLMTSRSNANEVTFLTIDETTFLTLKKEIDDRHNNSGGNIPVVEGKKFRYTFDQIDVEGRSFFAVIIALKSQF